MPSLFREQQENILKQQNGDVIAKEQLATSSSGSSGSSQKSVEANYTNGESEASAQVRSDFSAISAASGRSNDIWAELDGKLDDLERERKYKIKAQGKQLIQERLDEVTKQHEELGGLRDAFDAAKATGFEDFIGAIGDKGTEEYIRDGQRFDTLSFGSWATCTTIYI